MRTEDHRTWLATDRAGELVTVARPLAHVEVMSVMHSDRKWCDAHTSYVVAFVEEGGPPGVEATWQCRSRTYTTTNGGFFLFTPGSEHRTLHVREKASFSVVRFDASALESAHDELESRGKLRFRDPAKRDPLAHAVMQRLVRTVARGDDALALECAYAEAAEAVVARLGECGVYRLSDGLCHTGVRAVCAHLRGHLAERTTLSDLALLARLSRFGLCQAFRTRLGMSPGQYWYLCRVAKARDWLQDGAPARTVAHQLGFSDEAQFNRVFKRFYGVPPGRWARMARENGIASRQGSQRETGIAWLG